MIAAPKLDRRIQIYRLKETEEGPVKEYLTDGYIFASFRDLSSREKEEFGTATNGGSCKFQIHSRDVSEDCYVEMRSRGQTLTFSVSGVDRFEDKSRGFVTLFCKRVPNPEA